MGIYTLCSLPFLNSSEAGKDNQLNHELQSHLTENSCITAPHVQLLSGCLRNRTLKNSSVWGIFPLTVDKKAVAMLISKAQK